jgi:formylglycine-generating enzyme required for sulfatase activity
MRRWFLSYTSQDFALMQALKAAVQRRDADAHIFFAPDSMRAGGFWQQQLADEIAQSTAFVLLVGETGVGPWQVMEYYEALDRRAKEPDYPLILILSEKTVKRAAPGLPFVRQLHWVLTEDPASEATVGKLIDSASGPATRPRELWRYTRPYRGLEAMTEANSDFFFGRRRETVEVINVLAGERGKLPILLGNSGVGKSSLAQAGVLAALLRQGWPEQVKDAPPWPTVFDRSRHWCFLTLRPDTDPLKALVAPFLDTWQYGATNPKRVAEQNEWIELLREGKATLPDLLDVTEKRYRELAQPSPPAFFLYIDQGEELYVRAEKPQRRRFSEIVAAGIADPRLLALMSLRADFFGELLNDESLYAVHRLVKVPPLREAELYEVVSTPAELLSARFQTDTLAAEIARHTAEASAEDAGALPLLSYLLDDMWSEMVQRGDSVLQLPMQAFDLGRVLVDRANRFVAEHPGSEDALRRIFTLKLATVRSDGEPIRRRAPRSEFTRAEWRLVSELADYPNRLLVTGTLESGTGFAEVAHETIFRRWDKLREWIAIEREFLAWRAAFEAMLVPWEAAAESVKKDTPHTRPALKHAQHWFKKEALLTGLALKQAQKWLQLRADDLSEAHRAFIHRSVKHRRLRQTQAAAAVLSLAIVVGLGVLGWREKEYLILRWTVWQDALPDLTERLYAQVPRQEFRECSRCPLMVVVPAGEFTMGSPETERDRDKNEGPQRRKVTIAKPFAVSKFEVTFDDWDACAAFAGCRPASDSGWGRGNRPVIDVNWNDAKAYVNWLSKLSGKPYRLLTEAEWEYAARAGSATAYSWGGDIGTGNANCIGCGSQWDNKQTATVGSFAANAFGLHDMHGNVWEWVEDCYALYGAKPTCASHVIRGGSWNDVPRFLRSAVRQGITDFRSAIIGFRVARALQSSGVEVGDSVPDDQRGEQNEISQLPSHNQTTREPNRIKVTSATLGLNCGAPKGNVTEKVVEICDGQETCSLPGSSVNNPDPAPGCWKAFAVEWQCSGKSGARGNSVPAVPNETHTLTLSCR